MTDNKSSSEMLNALDLMLDEDKPYNERLEAYEFLMEDCEEIVDEMLKRSYSVEGDTGKMLMEILARYKGNKAIFMGLVSYLYRGDDVALFANLIGSYGDEQGIEVLKTFCEEYEPNYNEYMEIRNAVEELGGDFDLQEDFSDDPLYRYLKGLDEKDDRRSPFEGMWNAENDDCECHDDGCDDECGCHNDDCNCGHSHCEDNDSDDGCCCGHSHCDSDDCRDDDCHCHDCSDDCCGD